MGPRYSPEQLLFLKDSPLVKKPENLPATEEWMGPVVDNTSRAQAGRREASDRHSKGQDNPLFEQTNRRTASDRHNRGSANPEDIILGPPKTAFTSSTSIRNAHKSLDSAERPAKDGELARRVALHSKLGDIENERPAGRDGRRLRRTDGDQDTEGWSTVKPRKSFGAEGAERMFSGRMGGERNKDDRRRDNHDRDHQDRPARGFDNYSRDKDVDYDHDDAPRKERNGVGRGRNEPTWFKDKEAPLTNGRNGHGNRHVDSNRGWREKDRDDGDKGGDRGDRRWTKDQNKEKDPAWYEPSVDDSNKDIHTQEEFEKWKKSMNAKNGDTPAKDGQSKNAQVDSSGFEPGSFFGADPAPKVDTPLAIDTGPDKFFIQWAADKKEKSADDSKQDEGLATAKPVGKASRFNKFFTAPPAEDGMRRVTEPTPTKESAPKGDFQGLFGGSKPESTSEDKEAFAALLKKLQSQSIAPPHSTPPANINPPPPVVTHEARPQSATAQQMPDNFSPYQQDRQEEPRTRSSQQLLLDLVNQKPLAHGQNPNVSSIARPEQMLQEMISQRQAAQAQPTGRSEQIRDPDGDFILRLMQGQRAPVQQGMLTRRDSQGPNTERQLRQIEHEAQLAAGLQYEREQRERRAAQQAQRQVRKQDLPQGYYDEQMMLANLPQQLEQRNARPQQPTQILQRPPGLDNGMPPNWGGQQSNQLPPQIQQPRHIQPPPGLPGTPGGMLPMGMQQNMQSMNQNMQIPSGFPPGFLPGMAGGFEGPNAGMQRGGGPGPMPPIPPGFFPPPAGYMQQQQQQQHGRGMNTHGGYDAINSGGGNGVQAFLQQGQMFDGRQVQGQGQGPPFRR